MKFEKFNIVDDLKFNLLEHGYFRTTDIQFKTIPAILAGEDVLAIAQTGTGKTAAFAIPILDQVHRLKTRTQARGIQCLILVPTRELARQIGQVFSKLSKNLRAVSYAIYGGIEQDPQIRQLDGGVDILIATPGRMFDLIHQGHIDVSQVKVLVLDEADHMLDLGFIQDIESVKRKLKHQHQTLFFSATINPKIKKLAYSQIRSNALRIQISPEQVVSRNVSHCIARVSMDDKRHLLVNFLKANAEAKVLLFVRTQVRAQRVLDHLAKNQIEAVAIHGGMLQTEREQSLEQFRSNERRILVATDVSARGIDLPGITHVVNYDLPDEPENYVHRVGRTGRGFAKGDAISFVSPEEQDKLIAIEESINTQIPEIKVERGLLTEVAEPDLEDMELRDLLALEDAWAEKAKVRKRKK